MVIAMILEQDCMDSRITRFRSLDPLWRSYPENSPYLYAVGSPILFKDYNGEGPIVDFIAFHFQPVFLVASFFDIVIEVKGSLSAGAGLGAIFGTGVNASDGWAVVGDGNIARTFSGGIFLDLASGLGGVGFGNAGEGVKDRNVVVGAEASAKIGVTVHNKESVLDLAGVGRGV